MLNRVELLPCVNVSPGLEEVPLIPCLPHLPLALPSRGARLLPHGRRPVPPTGLPRRRVPGRLDAAAHVLRQPRLRRGEPVLQPLHELSKR